MAMVNIPSTCDDPQYRYKMPRLISKKEGRGNGSKTCIVNMSEVARALHRPPQYTTKWFGSELGAQSTYTNKDGEGERAIVNGHHDTPIFQTMLDKFIEKYVLCENCHLPEIDMAVKKGNIVAKCKACGWAGDLDNNHKLAAFISKNPPDESGNGIVNLAESGTVSKKTKDERRKEREEKRKAKQEGGGDDDDEDEEDDEKAERKERREKKERSGEPKEKKERSGEKKEKKDRSERKSRKEGEEGEEGDEAKKERREKKEKKERSGEKKEKKERSGERKEKKEKKERSSKREDGENKKDKESDDDSVEEKDKDDIDYDGDTTVSVISNMRKFIEDKGGKAANCEKPTEFFDELRNQQLAKGFDHKIRFYITLEALCGQAMDAKTVDDTKEVIDKVLDAVTLPPSDILWCFDAYLHVNEKAVRSYPMVLKVIYDEEWADEKAILKHYVEGEGDGGPGFEKAKTSGAPFFKWLQTAEESGSGSEEESGSE